MDKQGIEVRDALLKRITELEDENKNLKFRLSNVSGMLIDFCQSVQCYDIQQGTKGIKEGVEDYLESINFR